MHRYFRTAVSLTIMLQILGCPEDKVVFPSLYLSITGDPVPDGRIDRLVVVFRDVEGDNLSLFDGAQPNEHRYAVNLPPSVDIASAPYVLRVNPGVVLEGPSYAVVWGLSGGDDKPAAVWMGRLDLNLAAEVLVHLEAVRAECDEDGDGLKNCDTPGCCSGDEVLASDCADDNPVAHPLAEVPACLPCILSGVDVNCDGLVDECIDEDGDQAADCNESADCGPGDATVYLDAPELCDGKDNDCDSSTDEGIPSQPCSRENEFGLCAGLESCQGGQVTCDAREPAAEDCSDNIDNDCDNVINEGCDWNEDWDGDGVVGADDCNPYDSRFHKGSDYAICCQAEDFAEADLISACDFDCDGSPNVCVDDLDGDGVEDAVDCAPNDPGKFPGNHEKCGDGIDQDCKNGDQSCDLVVDEDSDQYGADGGVDCDDTNPNIHPGATEYCNGLDDDCNGIIDDGNPYCSSSETCAPLVEVEGQLQARCAPLKNAQPTEVGVCGELVNFGQWLCAHGVDSTAAPVWATEQSAGAPVAVICVDYYGGTNAVPEVESYCTEQDEDCDGETDEDFAWSMKYVGPDCVNQADCTAWCLAGTDCTCEQGLCRQTELRVKGDNCGIGVCLGGDVVCAENGANAGPDGQLECTSHALIVPETDGGGTTASYCDNLDNDCDGQVDGHTLPLAMTTCPQQGICVGQEGAVATKCVAGQWTCDYSALTNPPYAAQDICDPGTVQLDNDCDGFSNEDANWQGGDLATPCDGTGQCGNGLVECVAGTSQATCSTNADGSAPEDTVEICDELDNDCNGLSDDSLTWNGTLKGQTCDGVGECGSGVVECSKLDTVTTCSTNPDGTAPQNTTEVCDGLDNNCDGQTDLDAPPWEGKLFGEACDGYGECGAGTVVCAKDGSQNTTCSTNANGPDSQAIAEICDEKDNDCNQQADENLSWNGIPKGTACDGIGECGSGTVVCSLTDQLATCSTNANGPASEAANEICDEKDNDCDGVPDDGLGWQGTAKGQSCDGIGACGAGTVICAKDGSNKTTCSTNPNGTQPGDSSELCDLVDNDCDDETDEGLGVNNTDQHNCKLTGVCGLSTVVALCSGTGQWLCDYSNVPNYQPTEEDCDGLDNDCDGAIDEPISVQPTAADACDPDGVCAAVSPSCDGEFGWQCHYSDLATYVSGEEESGDSCDDLNNDCDGQTDEGYPDKFSSCANGVGQCQNVGQLICNQSGNALTCSVSGVFAGTPCNDGDACTHSDQCSGSDASACGGTNYTTQPDGLDCTDDVCDGDGGTNYVLQAGFCLIGNACVLQGETNPQNTCQACNTTQNTQGWTTLAPGESCTDFNGCTVEDACTAQGLCAGDGFQCDEGLACQVGQCEVLGPDNKVCNYDTLKPGTCLIDGVCYTSGQEKTPNGCLVCDPLSDENGWTSKPDTTSCNDGLKCTGGLAGDSCTGGVCGAAATDCDDGNECTADSCSESASSVDGCVQTPLPGNACIDDGITCTDDICNGSTCAHPVSNNNCYIDGDCFANNEVKADDTCLRCRSNLDDDAWSAVNDGKACEDGSLCTADDECVSGVCIGGDPPDCDDNNPCTSDFCPGLAGCQNTELTNFSFPPDGCPADGLACTDDVCVDGECSFVQQTNHCVIDNACVPADTPDPNNQQCASCDPAKSLTAYSLKDNFVSCTDGSGCTLEDSCQSGVCVAGNPPDCSSQTDECNTGVCSSTSDTTHNCVKAPVTDGTSCAGDGLACTASVCQTGVCDNSNITTGCLIGGACVVEDTLEAGNECRSCRPSLSTTGYSDSAQGVSCTDDGIACTVDACDGAGSCDHVTPVDQCTIQGVCYADGALNPGNPCQSCQVGASKTDWTNLNQGSACTSDGLDCTDDVCDASGSCLHTLQDEKCNVDNVCYDAGDNDPVNECRHCDPSTNKTLFQNKGTSASCTDDGNACTTDQCDGGGACAHNAKPVDTPCDDDVFVCTKQTCNSSAACLLAIQPNTCFVGDTCYADGEDAADGPCQICDPSLAQDEFTAASSSVDCGTCAQCDGAGACVADLSQSASDCDDCATCAALGTCQPVADGTDVAACDPYLCDGASSSCPATCTSDADCDVAHYCTSGGICEPVKSDGVACTSANECGSSYCVGTSGGNAPVCCDTECASQVCTGGVCQAAACGDGVVNGTEACDDGDQISNGEGTCVADCSGIQTCGDGTTNGTEGCDDGDIVSNGEGFCLADCSATQICGDGATEGTEACDDGDTVSGGEGDCVADCSATQTCGDGATDGTEVCDDGDAVSNGEGSCVADCSATQTCGDGATVGTEVCDDGDIVSNGEGSCVADCSATQICGDGTTNGTEVCDDGDAVSNGEGSCVADCSATQICGDGSTQGTETCDDSDLDSFDGCASTCRSPASHLMISEFAVGPDSGEFIEIYNPGKGTVALDNVYLSDSNQHYLLAIGQHPTDEDDFVLRFPAGATIGANAFIVVGLRTKADFQTAYGTFAQLDYVVSDGQEIPEIFSEKLGSSYGLSESSEMLLLFSWDQSSGVTQDLDYVTWGTDTASFMDRSGVTQNSATFQNDTAVGSQLPASAPHSAMSLHRCDTSEGSETSTGGNGESGHDETSEDISASFKISSLPSPGSAPGPGFCGPGGGNVHKVAVTDFAFVPSLVTLVPGDSVNWSFMSSTSHTVTSCTPNVAPPAIPASCALDASPLLDSGSINSSSAPNTYLFQFPTSGYYPYRCVPHPSMYGLVEVK